MVKCIKFGRIYIGGMIMGNLTQSLISRRNVLNNDYAVFEIQKQLKIEGMLVSVQ